MDNRRNPERDKALEEILNDFGKEKKKTTASGRSTYTSRSTSNRSTPRKTVNPSALSSNESKTTGFAVSKSNNTSVDEMSVNNAATAKMNIPEKTGTYRDYALNSSQSVAVESPTASMRSVQEPKAEQVNDRFYNDGNNIRKSRPEQHSQPVRKKRRKRSSARLPIVLMVTTLILTVSIVLSILIIAIGRDMLAIGKGDMVKMVTIPKGATATMVANILKEEEIIDIPKAFEIFSDLNGSDEKFIPGQYELSPSDAYETIINKLTTEPSEDSGETVTVTFIEGTSIYEAAQILEENNVCDADRFIYYFNAGGFNFDFETKLPTSTAFKFYKMEGYLFPDTYKFYVESEPESVCMKIYQNFENRFKDEYYTQMEKMGMTLDEVITLASIVQAEAPTADSMKKVSAVLQNRLANKEEFPMLQSDPTTYYVEEIIKPNIPVPSNAIFEAYDTYKGYGLPPGAIGNPGIDAIEAVLYPDNNDYYYFCADIDTMEIFYSETLEEHEEYLAQINGESSEDDEDSDEEDEEYYE